MWSEDTHTEEGMQARCPTGSACRSKGLIAGTLLIGCLKSRATLQQQRALHGSKSEQMGLPKRLPKYCLRLPASTMIQLTTALNTIMHEVTCRATHELLNMSEET